MKYLYRIYQTLVAVPIGIVITILTALVTIIGCLLGGGHFFGYYPGRAWAWLMLKLFLLPVKVEGRHHLEKGQSYVCVANHQGAFDIFLIYGHLNRNFRWMMKEGIRRIPFVGMACQASKQIFIDKRGPKRIQASYNMARRILQGGMSLVVFPEGSRSFTGDMTDFHRGAFMLADELQLPVVPITINGSFDVMPRTRDWHWANWHPLSLTIHTPIYPVGQGPDNVRTTMIDSYKAVHSALDERYRQHSDATATDA
ncbi:MAG: 1-acyl-sn-glycerol-3-phosphate acyltransferase [Prevotella sp.]|nr:1-acyl-sn-glycerol-3-phosphate acyltransferase [Prevotella sp.]